MMITAHRELWNMFTYPRPNFKQTILVEAFFHEKPTVGEHHSRGPILLTQINLNPRMEQ